MGASFLAPKSSDHCQIGPRSAHGQGTFVREYIIYELEASGARTKITVKTMNGGQTHLSAAVVDG